MKTFKFITTVRMTKTFLLFERKGNSVSTKANPYNLNPITNQFTDGNFFFFNQNQHSVAVIDRKFHFSWKGGKGNGKKSFQRKTFLTKK